MLAAARVTLKQHRFEVTVAALAAVAAAALGLSIAIRIDALHVSQACLDQVRASQDGSGHRRRVPLAGPQPVRGSWARRT